MNGAVPRSSLTPSCPHPHLWHRRFDYPTPCGGNPLWNELGCYIIMENGRRRTANGVASGVRLQPTVRVWTPRNGKRRDLNGERRSALTLSSFPCPPWPLSPPRSVPTPGCSTLAHPTPYPLPSSASTPKLLESSNIPYSSPQVGLTPSRALRIQDTG